MHVVLKETLKDDQPKNKTRLKNASNLTNSTGLLNSTATAANGASSVSSDLAVPKNKTANISSAKNATVQVSNKTTKAQVTISFKESEMVLPVGLALHMISKKQQC